MDGRAEEGGSEDGADQGAEDEGLDVGHCHACRLGESVQALARLNTTPHSSTVEQASEGAALSGTSNGQVFYALGGVSCRDPCRASRTAAPAGSAETRLRVCARGAAAPVAGTGRDSPSAAR